MTMSQSNLPEQSEAKVYAAFWRRLGATSIDAALLGTAGFAISYFYFQSIPESRWSGGMFPTGYYTIGDLYESIFVLPVLPAYLLWCNGDITIGEFSPPPTHDLHFLMFMLTFPMLNWLYRGIMESSSKQATIGKMLLKIKVTDLAGNRISFLRATSRHFSKVISTLIFSIGFIMAAFAAKKQALHDKMAGCLVVAEQDSVKRPTLNE